MKRLLKLLFLLIFIGSVALAVGIYWLVTDTEGLNTFVTQLQRWLPGKLTVNAVQGRMIDNFTIQGLSYHHEHTKVQLDSLHIAWQMEKLWDKKLQVRQLHLNGLHIQLLKTEKEETTEPFQLPEIQLPLFVAIDEVKIQRIAIQVADTPPILIDRLDLQAEATHELAIPHFEISSPQFYAKITGNLGLKTPHVAALKLDWSVNLPEESPLLAKEKPAEILSLAGAGTLAGNLQELTVVQQLMLRPRSAKTPLFTTTIETTANDLLGNLQWSGKVEWDALQFPVAVTTPLVATQRGYIKGSGTLQDYQLTLNTQLLETERIPAGQLQLKAHGNLQQLTIESLETSTLEGTIKANGQVQWLPALTAQFKMQAEKITPKKFWAEWPETLRLNSQIEATFQNQQLKITRCDIALPPTASLFSLQGEVLLTEQISAAITAQWQQLQWPLLSNQSPLVNSVQGNLAVTGTLENYQVRFNADVAGADIPAGQWQITGRGNEQEFFLEQLQGKVLQGNVHLQGKVGWQPHLRWDVKLNGSDVNPATQWQEWKGQLALAVESQGQLSATQGLEMRVQIPAIQGTLRGYPLKLQGRAGIQGNRYTIDQFDLYSGDTQLAINGRIDQQLALNWQINSPNLAALIPQLQGQLAGNGHITGALAMPWVVATLNGNALQFQEHQLQTLQIRLDAGLEANKPLQIELVASGLRTGNYPIEQVKIQGRGTPQQHTLTLDLKTPTENLSLQTSGKFIQPQARWQGQLERLVAQSTQFGTWKLQQPTSLILSATQAQLSHHCLQNAQATICSAVDWQSGTAGKTAVQVALNRIPLELARPFLPPDYQISGTIDGKLTASIGGDGNLTGETILTLPPGTVQTKLEEMEKLPYKGGSLRVQMGATGLTAQLEFGLLHQSFIKGHLTFPLLTRLPPAQQQPLRGELTAQFGDLNLLPLLVSQVENPKGTVTAALKIGGTLAKPSIQGEARIQNAAIELPELGLQFKDLNLALIGKGQDIMDIQASVRSGKGQLRLQGQAQLAALPAWNVNLKIEGEKFEVMNTPAVWALIAPAITVQLAPKRVDVTGNLTIPEAAITPNKEASGAVTVSKDVVIVNPQELEIAEEIEKEWAISSKVQLILGEKVTFKGAGFNSRLGGQLVASNQPHKVTTGNGELQIVEGTYKAYRQNLKIEKGRIIFAESPIDNPGLDIRAFRRIKHTGEDDIIAGIYIQGVAQEPRLSLYSEPAMDQSNTLSYILLGKPIAQATKGEGQSLVGALSSLSLEQGDNFTQKIGTQLGLDEAYIDSEGGIEETALVVGKYLSPKLYISYGIGLLGNTLKIRYELTKKITLEATETGVDLHYTIER